jgi:hypothetical protein
VYFDVRTANTANGKQTRKEHASALVEKYSSLINKQGNAAAEENQIQMNGSRQGNNHVIDKLRSSFQHN